MKGSARSTRENYIPAGLRLGDIVINAEGLSKGSASGC